MKTQSAFLRGFGSIASLRPRRHERIRFVFRGQEIADVSVEQALAGDWETVVSHLESAFHEEAREHHNECPGLRLAGANRTAD